MVTARSLARILAGAWLLLGGIQASAHAAAPTLDGEVVAGGALYPQEASVGNDVEGTLGVELDLRWDLGPDTRFRVLPRLTWDPADPARGRWVPTEAWVEHRRGPWTLRAGRLAVGWGSADLFNPTDLVSTRDWGVDFLDPQRAGDWGARLGFGRGSWGFEAVWLPVLEGTDFPSARSPWSFDAALERALLGGVPIEVDFAFDEDPRLPPGTSEQTVALRLRRTLGSTDLYLVGITGLDRSPIVTGSVRLPGAAIPGDRRPLQSDAVVVRARATYLPLHAVGLEFQSAVGEVLLKGAVVRRDQAVDDPAFSDEVTGAFGVRPRSVQGVVGVERLWFGALGGPGDLNVTVEFLFDDSPRGDNVLAYRPLQRDLAVGFTWSFNDFSATVLEGGWIQDLEAAESGATLRLRRRVARGTTLEIGGDLVLGPSGNPLSPFSLYGANGRLVASLRMAL